MAHYTPVAAACGDLLQRWYAVMECEQRQVWRAAGVLSAGKAALLRRYTALPARLQTEECAPLAAALQLIDVQVRQLHARSQWMQDTLAMVLPWVTDVRGIPPHAVTMLPAIRARCARHWSASQSWAHTLCHVVPVSELDVTSALQVFDRLRTRYALYTEVNAEARLHQRSQGDADG
jgi:hypothetical protein